MRTGDGRIAGAFSGRAAGAPGWKRRSGDDGDRASGLALFRTHGRREVQILPGRSAMFQSAVLGRVWGWHRKQSQKNACMQRTVGEPLSHSRRELVCLRVPRSTQGEGTKARAVPATVARPRGGDRNPQRRGMARSETGAKEARSESSIAVSMLTRSCRRAPVIAARSCLRVVERGRAPRSIGACDAAAVKRSEPLPRPLLQALLGARRLCDHSPARPASLRPARRRGRPPYRCGSPAPHGRR